MIALIQAILFLENNQLLFCYKTLDTKIKPCYFFAKKCLVMKARKPAQRKVFPPKKALGKEEMLLQKKSVYRANIKEFHADTYTINKRMLSFLISMHFKPC